MTTKAEIEYLATASHDYIADQVYRMVDLHKLYVETGLVAQEDVLARINALGTAIDLLLDPLIIHMKERIYHMASDTYALLNDVVSNILGLQELLHNLAVSTNK